MMNALSAKPFFISLIGKYDIEVIGLCQNGLEAYDMILDESPDIVLTDIRMPGMGGLELIQKLSQTDLYIQFINFIWIRGV